MTRRSFGLPPSNLRPHRHVGRCGWLDGRWWVIDHVVSKGGRTTLEITPQVPWVEVFFYDTGTSRGVLGNMEYRDAPFVRLHRFEVRQHVPLSALLRGAKEIK